jgi:hypothetical protein
MSGEFEHSSFKHWILQLDPKAQNGDSPELLNSDYISVVYGDHFRK